MNRQALFDKALFGIRMQAYEPSISDDGACHYRDVSRVTGSAVACGIGHSVTDAQYGKWMEGGGLIAVLEHTLSVKQVPYAFFALAVRVQTVHDDYLGGREFDGTPLVFETRMRMIAESEGLYYTPPVVPVDGLHFHPITRPAPIAPAA